MRALEEIKARCEIDGKHWMWEGGTTRKRPIIYGPDFTKDPSGATCTPQYGVRAVWHMKQGKPMKKGWRAYATCWRPMCLSPECVAAGPMSQLGHSMARSGAQKGLASRRVANRVTAKGFRKVTDEMAAAFRASNLSGNALGAQYKLHPTTINKWRAGTLGKTSHAAAGMFTDLLR